MGFGGKAVIAVLIVAVLGGAVWAMGLQAGTTSTAPDQGIDATPSPTSDEAGAESTDATERQGTDADGSSGAAPPTEDDDVDDSDTADSDGTSAGGDGDDGGSSGGDGDDGSSAGGDDDASDGSSSGSSGGSASGDGDSNDGTGGGDGTEPDETRLAVDSTSVAADGTAEVRLTLEAAPEGMAGFRAQIAVDADLATVEGATPADEFDQISSVDVAGDGSSVTVEAVDDRRVAEPGASDVHLATITVGGVDAGTSPLDLTTERFDDDDGTTIDVATSGGEVEVESTGSGDQ